MQVGGIRIGKVFGIELWLDYSWFVLFFLIALGFTAGLLPARFPELGTPGTVLIGLVITLLFFGSVVAHEMSHSLYARSQGLGIRRITLFIFGAAAEVEDETQSPRQEFVMAAVGPLTSLGLGLLFGVVWLLGSAFSNIALIAVGNTLSFINIVLAIFNLLPGFPMDGGRMFRAVAWKSTGDLERATRYAAAGGKTVAFLLVIIGLLQLLLGGIIGGLWLVLIGFFLNRAASFSYQQTVSRLLLKDVKVEDLMQRDFVSVPRETPIKIFLQKYVLRHKETAMPTEADEAHPAGIIDAGRLPEPAPDGKVGQFALQDREMLRPGDPAIKAFNSMARSGLSKLPVADNGKLVGVLTVQRIQAYILGRHKLRAAESLVEQKR